MVTECNHPEWQAMNVLGPELMVGAIAVKLLGCGCLRLSLTYADSGNCFWIGLVVAPERSCTC